MWALTDFFGRMFGRFGRMQYGGGQQIDADMGEFDDRLTDVEHKQRDIAARLRLLEMAADPRGRLRDED